MKPLILQTLQLTLIGDNAKLAEAHSTLVELAKNQGYCINLMEIIDDNSLNISIKQAALVQLKNTIRLKWKPKRDKETEMSAEQKNLIKKSVVMAVIRCAKIFQLIKLYREIITSIVSYEYREWLPVDQIMGYIDQNQYLEPCMHCLIAIVTHFQFTVKERQFFHKLTVFILPKVFNMIKNNQSNSELFYLGLKFFWKTAHYDLSKEGKELSLDWMQLLHNAITAYNEECQNSLEEILQKNTIQFYYFHSKKWATRIVLRYLQKHARSSIYGTETTDNQTFSTKWHSVYGTVFLKTIIEQIKIPTIKKTRFFQFKCLQNWVVERPELIKEHVPLFQYEILPNYLKLKPEDEHLANTDPIEYLSIEEESSLNFTNLKRAATDLWISMFQMQSEQQPKKQYIPGPFFNDNLNFLVKNLSSGNLLDKEYTMYLISQIRGIVYRVKEAYKKLLQIFPIYVLPQFQNSVIFMRMRANDIFIQYGRENFDLAIIEKAAQKIYTCLSADPSPLVKIKAASAFYNILYHQNAKGLVQPLLKNILQIYLKMIQAYDLEELVKGLEHIVSNFAQEISPFAIDLFKYLASLFIKLFHKDLEQNKTNEDYEGETELTASGCLKAMAEIMRSPLSQDMRKKLQQNVLQMCYFVLCQESIDYTEDMLGLLNVHLFQIQEISPSLWFFFQVVIYFLVGIPREFWAQLQKINLPDKFKKLLLNIKDSQNQQCFEYAVPVIRNYITKGVIFFKQQTPEFKLNFINIHFYLVATTYKLHSKYEGGGQIDLDCCTIVLIYLIESCEENFIAPMLKGIWSYCKYNFSKSRTSMLRAITSMLAGVIWWKYPIPFLKILKEENSVSFAIKQMIKYNSYLDEGYQRKRLVLGILSILMIAQKPQQLLDQLPILYKCLLSMIKNNSRIQIIKYMDKKKNSEEEMGISKEGWSESYDFGLPNDDDAEYSDEEDFWDEVYQQNYNSPLEQHNELAYFKDYMIKLKEMNPQLYENFVNLVPSKELMLIDRDLEKALSIMQSATNA